MTASAPVLVELCTEELPPKALEKLGNSFGNTLFQQLQQQHLLNPESQLTVYASPRRLAALISHVKPQAPEQTFEEKLMPVSIALDANGQPTPALLKKLTAKNIPVSEVPSFIQVEDGKNTVLVYRGVKSGAYLTQGLQVALDASIQALPIPKMMQYQLADGVTTVKFVRPAQKLVAIHGSAVVPLECLGLKAGRETLGHRFQCKTPVAIDHASHYDHLLKEQGKVIASFPERKQQIHTLLQAQAQQLGLSLGDAQAYEALLEEVTALVEFPTVYQGQFEPEFLAVPSECLTLTMRLNQKYFPLFQSNSQALDHRFLIVSNMHPADPQHIIQGNERVIRPRLADAQFFFATDRKQRLASRIPQLESIIYHQQLGSQAARSQRVAALARWIAEQMDADGALAERTGLLAKTDLVTLMVGEFPELQGIIGAYYAEHDGEPTALIEAIRHQYDHRWEVEVTPDTLIRFALYVADRVETLIGIWSTGAIPTGEKDPYGLRRAALGILSAFESLAASRVPNIQSLELTDVLTQSAANFGGHVRLTVITDVQQFIYERYRQQLLQQYNRPLVEAVISRTPPIQEVHQRIAAVQTFSQLPAADSLAAANKRIQNILKKQAPTEQTIDRQYCSAVEEIALLDWIEQHSTSIETAYAARQFTEVLQCVAECSHVVDAFFDQVMVMAEDANVRNNRLAILQQLSQQMMLVADLSQLAT